MTVLFDTATGRLRLDRASVDALLAWVDGGAPAPEAMAALTAAGVVDSGGPHPVLLPVLDAITEPVCRLRLERDGQPFATGWATVGGAAVLLPLPDDLLELIGLHPSFVPAALARLIGLGPRRRHDGDPWQVPSAVLDALLRAEPDGAEREEALAAIDGEAVQVAGDHAAVAVDALAAGRCRRWTATAEWQAAQQPGSRRLDLLDASPVGVWLLEPTGERVVLWPTTPTAVWRSLARLMPGDAELATP